MTQGLSAKDKLRRLLCCCGDDHAVADGGRGINVVQLDGLARWPYMAVVNFLVAESKDNPLACAVVCDHCLSKRREILYAIKGEPGADGEPVYSRVPVSELEEPAVYWPDLHPDAKKPQRFPAGVDRIQRGECPHEGLTPMACMFCVYGHMLECHHPYTCEEAKCSHYQVEREGPE